ncbi:MAG: cytochrome P460 family protein [Bacteroidetes bacterium]|nr:cytochrome P460 family protein [Bacteroidota bacterium]
MTRKYFYPVFIFSLLFLVECRKDTTPPAPETDAALFARATSGGYTYYKGDASVHHSSPQSAHGGFFRVRFNAIAQAALTDQGKLPTGATFPNGSIIVKELHNDSTGTQLHGYAIMEKLPSDTSQADGWIWAEVNTSGAGYTINNKGAICTGCHSIDDRDHVRLFDLFP